MPLCPRWNLFYRHLRKTEIVMTRSKSVIVIWLLTGAVLTIAALLTADTSGVGTHTQLGLGECTFLRTTGLPCPMCGMTTTFTHMAHFHWIDGLLTQPFGAVLFLMTAVVFVLASLDLIRPAGRLKRIYAFIQRFEFSWAIAMLSGLLLGWGYKVALFKGWIIL